MHIFLHMYWIAFVHLPHRTSFRTTNTSGKDLPCNHYSNKDCGVLFYPCVQRTAIITFFLRTEQLFRTPHVGGITPELLQFSTKVLFVSSTQFMCSEYSRNVLLLANLKIEQNLDTVLNTPTLRYFGVPSGPFETLLHILLKE